ncbi:MAG: YdcF family protein [Brevefilum sp.]
MRWWLSGGAGDRLDLAIRMHADGIASNLVITDTASGPNNRLIREAVRGGFRRESIYVTDLQVDSTYEEALAVRDLALARNWDKVMVATDPYHTFRTRLVFRRELRGSGIEVLVRPVSGHWFTSRTWFYRAEGWQLVLLEFGKLFNDLFLRG